MKTRILFYDIETFPNKVYTWPGLFEVNVIKVIKDGEMASFAYKWAGEKKVYCETREGQKSDKALIKKLHKVLAEADLSIAHNGNAFDNRVSNTRILKHKILPPPPRKYIDTKVEAKKHFRFNGNSLSELARFLGLGDKIKTGGFELWEDAMADVSSAWKKMARYNKHDVVLLESVYERMKPWIKMPAGLVPGGRACAACGGLRLKSHGLRYAEKTAYRRLQCLSCGHWNQETVGESIVREIKSL